MYWGYFDVVVEAINLPTAGARGAAHTGLSRSSGRRLRPGAASPVAPPRSIGAGPARHRRAAVAFVRDGIARPALAPAPAPAGRMSPESFGGREAIRIAGPSSPFLAQYLAQRLDPGSEPDGHEALTARLVYQAAAARDTTYFGIAAPIDIVV